MSKLTNWIDEKLFKLRTGYDLEIANDGKPVEEVIIQCRGYYLSVMFDPESGEPTGNFGWSDDGAMFPVPIRDHLVAVKRGDGEGEV